MEANAPILFRLSKPNLNENIFYSYLPGNYIIFIVIVIRQLKQFFYYLQFAVLWFSLTAAFPTKDNNEAAARTPINTNTIQRIVETIGSRVSDEARLLKKVFLSNRSVTCNDGSQAG